MQILKTEFNSRENLIEYVRGIAPWSEGDASLIKGGYEAAQEKLLLIDPVNYGNTRNYGDGKITRLSPYITHGVISLNNVRENALKKCSEPVQITKFIQELSWRDFWLRAAKNHPDWLWTDVEQYKTGFLPSDYSDELPEDIKQGSTGVACIDSFIKELVQMGYIHNHARMYLASYIIHFRRIKWQAGAKWFLEHLLDGEAASNNLSWQWVASTFSNKPYIFNLENVAKYFSGQVDVSPNANKVIDKSYEDLNRELFPNISL